MPRQAILRYAVQSYARQHCTLPNQVAGVAGDHLAASPSIPEGQHHIPAGAVATTHKPLHLKMTLISSMQSCEVAELASYHTLSKAAHHTPYRQPQSPAKLASLPGQGSVARPAPSSPPAAAAAAPPPPAAAATPRISASFPVISSFALIYDTSRTSSPLSVLLNSTLMSLMACCFTWPSFGSPSAEKNASTPTPSSCANLSL